MKLADMGRKVKMNFRKLYEEELGRSSTNYFILDTGGNTTNVDHEHDDIDFEEYVWHTDRYNLVKENDLFIYRRQMKASEISGEFYFFGAGKIEEIKPFKGTEVFAKIGKSFVFKEKLLKSDLENFEWNFKKRGDNWSYFFNQYGMNKIEKEDFVNLLDMQENRKIDYENVDIKIEVELYQQQQKGVYRVEDKKGTVSLRGSAQKVFADKVKANYGYVCAITGIRTRDFLVASHIIPWAEDKENRINPKNGICLSSIFDKAFDKGYISIDSIGKVIVSGKAKEDPELYKILVKYEGSTLNVKKEYAPDKTFLNWHIKNIYKG